MPSIVPTVEITKEEYKTVYFKTKEQNLSKLDSELGGVEEGLNIIFGDPDTGKTNTCAHLAFNALEQGMNVKYYDLERGIHKKRILQMYESRGHPFDMEKLNQVFVRPREWNWTKIVEEWYKIMRLEKPDMFIIDSVTPAFLEKFESEQDSEHWDTLKKRDLLAIDSYRTAFENDIILIMVAQEKGSKTDTASDSTSRLKDFSGTGRRFAFLAKMWLYTYLRETAVGDLTKSERYFLLLKHRFIPDYTKTGKKIPFDIVDQGIVGL